jgi:hypothetical protein
LHLWLLCNNWCIEAKQVQEIGEVIGRVLFFLLFFLFLKYRLWSSFTSTKVKVKGGTTLCGHVIFMLSLRRFLLWLRRGVHPIEAMGKAYCLATEGSGLLFLSLSLARVLAAWLMVWAPTCSPFLSLFVFFVLFCILLVHLYLNGQFLRIHGGRNLRRDVRRHLWVGRNVIVIEAAAPLLVVMAAAMMGWSVALWPSRGLGYGHMLGLAPNEFQIILIITHPCEAFALIESRKHHSF